MPDKHLGIHAPERADHMKEYRWQKGVSPNPHGRPKKESSIRSWLKEIESEKLKKLSDKQKDLLRNTIGYEDSWSYGRTAAALIWAKAVSGDKDHLKLALEYTIGRPVPLTDMPTIVVNQQTIVEQHQETSIDKAVGAFKALVEAGIVPAEIFQQYAVISGNGHANGHDESDR